jgi:hypoxanthine-guanine phosphoribosyltransferase
LAQAALRADHACFSAVDAFIAGYGMDDQGRGRGGGDIIAL